jgi:hypothetical protein
MTSLNMIHLTKLLTRSYREDEGDPMPTSPVSINVAAIRNFYPRNDRKPGTRITFTDGGGYVVTESYADVKRYIETGEAPAPREPVALVTDANVETVN